MSTYLVCYFISKFTHHDTTNHNNGKRKTPKFSEIFWNLQIFVVTVRVWMTPSMAGFTDYALTSAAKLLEFYSEFFGVAYPLPKMDLIALPKYGNLMSSNDLPILVILPGQWYPFHEITITDFVFILFFFFHVTFIVIRVLLIFIFGHSAILNSFTKIGELLLSVKLTWFMTPCTPQSPINSTVFLLSRTSCPTNGTEI